MIDTKKRDRSPALSGVLVKLLQGFVLSDDKKHWEALLTYQETVREYVQVLGLQLHLSSDDGYAFLRPRGGGGDEGGSDEEELEGAESSSTNLVLGEEDGGPRIPSLVRKFPLTFEVSLLCVLLREALEQFDSRVNDDHRLILHRSDLHELLKVFYEEKTDETKLARRFDGMIGKVVELGFLKELKGDQNSFEVRRVIKALIDMEKLTQMKEKMRLELRRSSSGPELMEEGDLS